MSAKITDHTRVRQQLEQRRAELYQRGRRIDADLGRAAEALPADFAEQATQVENDEPLTAIGQAAAEEIQQIDTALARLDAGQYGVCKQCGKPIEPLRLAAVPHSVSCTHCLTLTV